MSAARRQHYHDIHAVPSSAALGWPQSTPLTRLTPTSYVHDIYSHVTSIKQLRQLGNAFDAILLLQQSASATRALLHPHTRHAITCTRR